MERKRHVWVVLLLLAGLPLSGCLQKAAPPSTPGPTLTETPTPEVSVEEIPEIVGEPAGGLGEISEPELEANETVDLGSVL